MIHLSTKEIANIIAKGESETIEFKETLNNEAIETIGAFANARGGIILIGVRDNGTICGFQTGRKSLEDIAHRVQEVTDPRLQPSLTIVSLEGQNILVIQVEKSSGVPISVRGRFFKRSGRTNQRMSHEEIMRRMVKSSGLSWDVQPEIDATLKDIDTQLVKRFTEASNQLGRRPVPEQAIIKEILEKLDLIQDGTPTRAALLLFGHQPNKFFPSAFLKLGRFRSPTVIVDDREVYGSLIHQLDETMSWFRERLATEFTIAGKPEREVRWEYPLNAIREAVINLLCHRDYTNGAHSQIRLYDDHLNYGMQVPYHHH